MTDAAVPFLDLSAQYRQIKPQLDAAVARVMNSGHYILGPEVEAFEQNYARWVGADHCVGCGNGLDAISLALRALGIQAGDEVIVPSHTFIATWLAVASLGAIPVPVEPDEGTFNLSAANVERAITPATKAVVAVHLYGHPADLDGLLQLARSRNLVLVEDAAQAHGATYRGRRIGSIGDATTWSFYPGKNLGAMGDGGAVTTSNADVAQKIRILRNYGSQVKYQNDVQGVNSRLDPLQAAILAAKLPFLTEWNTRRQVIAQRYTQELGDLPIRLPVQASWAESVWHLYVIRSPRRDALMQGLADLGIQTLIHYPIPPHLQGAFRQKGPAPSFPIAEQMAKQVLSLPIGPHMTDDQLQAVIDGVRRVAIEQVALKA